MNSRIKNQLNIIVLILICIIFATACNNASTKTAKSESQSKVKREKLEVKLESLRYDEGNKEVNAEIRTNLPDGTKIFASLQPPNSYIGELVYATIEKGKPTKLSFMISDEDKVHLTSGEYGINVSVEVDGDDTDNNKKNNIDEKNKNEHILSDTKVGGVADDLKNEYANSKFVKIDASAYNRYYIRISSSNKIVFNSGISDEEMTRLKAKDEAGFEKRYAENMRDHIMKMQEQFVKFDNLFKNPQFSDTNWKIDLSVAITEISRLSQEPKGFSVPDKYKETHALYLEAMDNYKKAMDIFPNALDTMSSVKINEAKGYMDQALEKVKTVQGKLPQ